VAGHKRRARRKDGAIPAYPGEVGVDISRNTADCPACAPRHPARRQGADNGWPERQTAV